MLSLCYYMGMSSIAFRTLGKTVKWTVERHVEFLDALLNDFLTRLNEVQEELLYYPRRWRRWRCRR